MKKAADKKLYKRKQNKGKEFKDISDETYDKLRQPTTTANATTRVPALLLQVLLA